MLLKLVVLAKGRGFVAGLAEGWTVVQGVSLTLNLHVDATLASHLMVLILLLQCYEVFSHFEGVGVFLPTYHINFNRPLFCVRVRDVTIYGVLHHPRSIVHILIDDISMCWR